MKPVQGVRDIQRDDEGASSFKCSPLRATISLGQRLGDVLEHGRSIIGYRLEQPQRGVVDVLENLVRDDGMFLPAIYRLLFRQLLKEPTMDRHMQRQCLFALS